jgi:uncharacterized protein YbcI
MERGAQRQSDERDSLRQAIQREIIQLHKEYFGRGPLRSKLYMERDSVLVLMYEGHTRGEESLRQAGERRSVAQSRVDISESARRRFIEVVERHTGRKVVGFMSSSQQDPDLLSHVYVLEPTDLLDVERTAPPPAG